MPHGWDKSPDLCMCELHADSIASPQEEMEACMGKLLADIESRVSGLPLEKQSQVTAAVTEEAGERASNLQRGIHLRQRLLLQEEN